MSEAWNDITRRTNQVIRPGKTLEQIEAEEKKARRGKHQSIQTPLQPAQLYKSSDIFTMLAEQAAEERNNESVNSVGGDSQKPLDGLPLFPSYAANNFRYEDHLKAGNTPNHRSIGRGSKMEAQATTTEIPLDENGSPIEP